jgi:iron complex transport system ATP-binding protein
VSGAEHVLDVRALTFAYRPDRPVLRGVDLRAASGELVCVLGRNGSGKTTLLRCLLRLLRPGGGQMRLDGRPLAAYSLRELARRMAYVPQSAAPAFAFSAREVVLMGRLAHAGTLGLAGPADLAVARAALQMTRAEEFEDRTLDELSGGEAQRVLIARALAQQPMILLLDEPTSHLDLENQLRIYAMLRRVAHEWPMAVVCISHDINLAARYADRLVVLGEGRVAADGPPEAVITAATLGPAFNVEVDLVPCGGTVPLVRARERAAGEVEA